MRKLSIALLLVSATSIPSIASAQEPAQNRVDVQHRPVQHNREAGTAQVRARNVERRAINPAGPQGPATTQGQHLQVRDGARVRSVEQQRVTVAPPVEQQRVTVVPRVERRRTTVVPRIDNRQINRSMPQVTRPDRVRPPVISRTPRIGTQPPVRIERNRPNWNRSWRNDRRYDWNNWRLHNRPVFRLRPYRDPYGWAYQLLSIGWRLWPQYYGSSYWIADPAMYRLPPAPPGTRWIRYYNDALLVDMYTGEVIDVIHDFFW